MHSCFDRPSDVYPQNPRSLWDRTIRCYLSTLIVLASFMIPFLRPHAGDNSLPLNYIDHPSYLNACFQVSTISSVPTRQDDLLPLDYIDRSFRFTMHSLKLLPCHHSSPRFPHDETTHWIISLQACFQSSHSVLVAVLDPCGKRWAADA